jgi:glycosyltransferase involved in cell wall biosynthesis
VRPLKRIDLLLRAFAAMQTSRATRLLILAGGSFEPYDALLDELQIRDRVIVNEDVIHVEEYLEAADAGLYTSETESFGLSILETLFHGKPVVAFGIGGIPEVVTDGESGFLHEFGNVEAMAASLDRLASTPSLAQEMGAQGKLTATAKFSADKIVPLYEQIYERLIERA